MTYIFIQAVGGCKCQQLRPPTGDFRQASSHLRTLMSLPNSAVLKLQWCQSGSLCATGCCNKLIMPTCTILVTGMYTCVRHSWLTVNCLVNCTPPAACLPAWSNPATLPLHNSHYPLLLQRSYEPFLRPYWPILPVAPWWRSCYQELACLSTRKHLRSR